MRSRNWPPCWRANARLNNDMYAVPTCGSPVGDGATRTRTGPAAVSATGHHPVRQRADLLDRDGHLVADRERADTRRSAREDDIARQQRHRLAHVRDQLVDTAHHL